MRRLVGTTRLLEAFDSLRRRLVGASVGGLLAATVLPAGLLALVEPPHKGSGPLGEGRRLALPIQGARPPSSFAAIEHRETIEGHLTPADIRRALIASRAQRKRILDAHPHFRLYKEAKRRYGVSWYLVAALHDRRRGMSGAAVIAAARGLRDAGAGSRLDRRAWRALVVHFGGPRAARAQGSRATAAASRAAVTRASLVLERARAWKQLGVIPLPAGDKLATPVDGVVPGCGYFHCPRPGHLHNGLDLSAPAGTPVHAVQAGRVAVLEGLGESGGYGLFVCLQHAPALASCYAHLSRFAPGLAVGREVGRGEVIGLVGCTGHCFGDHLHFEIRRGPAECSACAVDPVPYLSGKVPDVPAPALAPRARRPVPVSRSTAPPGPPHLAAPPPAAQPPSPPGSDPGAAGETAPVDESGAGSRPPAATDPPSAAKEQGGQPAPTAPSREPGRRPPASGTSGAPAAPAPSRVPAPPPPPPATAAPEPPPPAESGGAQAPPPGR